MSFTEDDKRSTLQDYLSHEASYDKINSLGRIVFTEGHHDRMDEFLEEILPLVNMAYFQYIHRLDDRRYSYEDLIQDSIYAIYKDITLRWDKLVGIQDYFNYFKIICRNVMLSVVQRYHNYYSHNELDPNAFKAVQTSRDYNEVDARITKTQVEDSVIKMMRQLSKCRYKHVKALDYIITYRYVNREDMESIKNSLRVLGVGRNLMNFMFAHLTYLSRLAYNYQRVVLDNNMKEVARFEEIFSRFEEPTYKILADNYFDTILPEFFAEFGAENTKKFVKLFGGKQINLPDYQNVSDDLMGGVLLNLTGGNRDKMLEISKTYDLKHSHLVRIMDRVEKYA